MITVTHYGVHWAPGKIAFLHQERGSTNAVGLKEASPFAVKTRRRWPCNHLLGINAVNPARPHMDRFRDLVGRNSLVRFMLPIPGQGVGVLHTTSLTHVAYLLKMSAPIRLPIVHASFARASSILEELEATNVQPLVLAGIEAKHTDMVASLVKAAQLMPRSLLILAAPDVPLRLQPLEAEHMSRQDDLDLVTLPWESLGALVLRAYMRGEWAGDWFTREPIPANEPKVRGGSEA